MGCCYSRIEREEMASRCEARKRYMKQFVKARQALFVAHSMYIRALCGTSSALLQFATAETNLHYHHHHHHHHHHLTPIPPSPPPQQPSPPPPPPPMSPSFDTWTSIIVSPSHLPPPPHPPPPPPQQPSEIPFFFKEARGHN